MLIKIPKKGGASNKNKTIPHMDAHQSDPSATTGPKNTSPYLPFLDKISLILSPSLTDDAFALHGNIWTQLKSDEFFPNAYAKSKWGQYKIAKRIMLKSVADAKRYPLLQYSHHHKKWVDLRLEFVPIDLGSKGIEELHASLSLLVEGGWNAFVERGRITRLDVAVDVPGVRMEEFFLLPKQLATTKQWRTNGTLETYTSGKKDGNQTVIYSQKAKRIAKHQEWHGKSVVRIERRLRQPSVKLLSDLKLLPNPFAAMKMVENIPDAPPGEDKPYIWALFALSAQQVGVQAALGHLPQARRSRYRKHLEAHMKPWWDVDAIWCNWPSSIDETGILQVFKG